MKQKLALACTLVHEPRVILLDEPTTGVDPVSRREFWKLLSEFLELGITILVSTPYLDEAERCARVALLHEGRLLALDTPDALRAGLPGRIVEMIAADQVRAVSVARDEPGVADVQTFGERAHVRFAAGAGADAAARLARQLRRSAGVAIRSLREVPPSLEDVFIARLQEQGDGHVGWSTTTCRRGSACRDYPATSQGRVMRQSRSTSLLVTAAIAVLGTRWPPQLARTTAIAWQGAEA